MNKYMELLAQLTAMLTQTNVAVPIVFGTISSIASIIKGVTGEGPSLSELATMMEQQIAHNDLAGREEIARLKELIAAQGERG